jgi:superfamily II DNA or RNA helicase
MSTSFNLKPFQLRTVERLRIELEKGKRKILICSPTGSGKTIIALDVINKAVLSNKKGLLLAHNREIISQFAKKLSNQDIDFNLIMGGSRLKETESLITLATIQSYKNIKFKDYDYIIIDEAHHAAASNYRRLIEFYNDKVIIGFTATPKRLDRKSLNDIFEIMIEAATMIELIKENVLIKPKIFSLDKTGTEALTEEQENNRISIIETEIMKPKMVGKLVENWSKYASGMRTIAFGRNIDHAEMIAEKFNSHGIQSVVISYKTRKKEREQSIKLLERNEIKLISNCGLFSEGIDIPTLECVIIATPTLSLSKYMQMVGRVIRTHPSKNSAVILDHAGCIEKHGLPYIYRNWDLNGEKMLHCNNPDCGYWFSKGMLFFNLAKAKDSIILCPNCKTAVCSQCKTLMSLTDSNYESDGFVKKSTLECGGCNSRYINEIILRGSAEQTNKNRQELNEILKEISIDSIEIIDNVTNSFAAFLLEAKQLKKRRSWAYHKMVIVYGKDLANKYIQRKPLSWWNAFA